MPDFETIYHQYFRFVWASARRLGVGAEAIDDVVQEVFLVIHRKLHTVHRPEVLRSWIYGIVRRTASTHRRAHKPIDDLAQLPESRAPVSHVPSPLSLTEQRDDLKLLERLLAGLSETKREVFLLVEVEEMTVPEVADALEIPVNTAYSRLRHARREFEAALARHKKTTTREALS